MSEIEFPTKTCMRCGTNCDLLVLVCPNCSEVLPDGKPTAPEFPTYEFPPDRLSANQIRLSESGPNELSPPDGQDSESNNMAIGKVVLFLIAFAICLWLLSGAGK